MEKTGGGLPPSRAKVKQRFLPTPWRSTSVPALPTGGEMSVWTGALAVHPCSVERRPRCPPSESVSQYGERAAETTGALWLSTCRAGSSAASVTSRHAGDACRRLSAPAPAPAPAGAGSALRGAPTVTGGGAAQWSTPRGQRSAAQRGGQGTGGTFSEPRRLRQLEEAHRLGRG